MNFNFTPYDIIAGKVDYSLEQFLRALFQQAKREVDQIPTYGEHDRKKILNGWYKLVVEVCYTAAGQYTLEDYYIWKLKTGTGGDPCGLAEVLVDIEQNNPDNIKIMDAIVTRECLNARKMGISEKDARALLISEAANIMNRIFAEEGMTLNYPN